MLYEFTRQLLSENEDSSLFDYYGTLSLLINQSRVTLKKLNEWQAMIDNMPNLFKITVGGRKYIIVHAGYIEPHSLKKTKYSSLEDFYLCARDEAYLFGGAADSTIICGHTPTLSKSNIPYNNGLVYKKIDESKKCTFYNIDCGCAYKETQPNAHLACIRLDDEEIFYI